MLEVVRLQTSDRKRRLFGCAGVRRVWHLLADGRLRDAVECRERHEDGLASDQEIAAAMDRAAAAVAEMPKLPRGALFAPKNYPGGPPFWAALAALKAASGDSEAAFTAAYGVTASSAVQWRRANEAEKAVLCSLLRCLFGNPFRPVEFDPAWRTVNVVAVARGVYDDRAFDRLPVLADALMDAGCANEEVLAHCRGPGPHACGCWVVDLVLGKG